MGAAVQAGIIAGEITDLILLDVTPLSLGVETMGGLMTTIINRNASIPTKQSEVFSTGSDQQDTVEIHVLQGERPFAKDNKSLGIFKLKGIPLAPRGVPKISVTFQLDVDGLLSVSAREEKTGQEQSIKIEGASVLAREEVSKMVKEAEENALLDKSKKSFVNVSYEIDNLIAKLESLLENNQNISHTPAYRLIESVLNGIKYSYKSGKFDSILKKFGKLTKKASIYLFFAYFDSKLNPSSKKVIDVS
jgi:molecular chaperone DnaK|eukprot:gene11525-12901_t